MPHGIGAASGGVCHHSGSLEMGDDVVGRSLGPKSPLDVPCGPRRSLVPVTGQPHPGRRKARTGDRAAPIHSAMAPKPDTSRAGATANDRGTRSGQTPRPPNPPMSAHADGLAASTWTLHVRPHCSRKPAGFVPAMLPCSTAGSEVSSSDHRVRPPPPLRRVADGRTVSCWIRPVLRTAQLRCHRRG